MNNITGNSKKMLLLLLIGRMLRVFLLVFLSFVQYLLFPLTTKVRRDVRMRCPPWSQVNCCFSGCGAQQASAEERDWLVLPRQSNNGCWLVFTIIYYLPSQSQLPPRKMSKHHQTSNIIRHISYCCCAGLIQFSLINNSILTQNKLKTFYFLVFY